MMKQSIQVLSLAMLLARATAQATTIINNPANTDAVTSYFSTCPQASTTTITLDTTTTICPGPKCGGITTVRYNAHAVTTVGPDGRTTIYEPLTYTAPCPCDGGICDAVYTITRDCPCTAPHPATAIPSGFTTGVVACNACAKNGGPSSVTVITPIATGPWASQTPVMGKPHNGAYASAEAHAYAYASAGPNGAVATAGANAVASAGSGSAGASADADADADAAANAGGNSRTSASNSTSGAGASVDANADTGDSHSGSNSTGIFPPITPYHGSADRTTYSASVIFAGILACLASML